jgi:phenylacetate-CoA ligase
LSAAVDAAGAAAKVPAYEREWSGLGEITADTWADIPFLSKERLIESVSNGDPYGDRLGVEPGEVAWVFVAPGPIYMPYTVADMNEIADRFASTFASCGITADDVVDQTTLYNWVIAATALGRGLERLGCTVIPGGSGETARHLDAIEQLNVTGILAFPTFLVHLMEQATAAGRTLPLKKAVVMGELHNPKEKERLAVEHGIVVREYYGTADVGPVAAECVEGKGMHLRHGVYVEFIDPETGQAVDPSPGRPAELVVTDLVRRGMPIIRLRTGDLIDELITAQCACGNDAPRIRRIVGRTGDITKIKGMFVVPTMVGRVLRRHDAETDYQLVVTREEGRDRLCVVLAGEEPVNWSELHAEIEHDLRLRCDYEFRTEVPAGSLLDDQRALG